MRDRRVEQRREGEIRAEQRGAEQMKGEQRGAEQRRGEQRGAEQGSVLNGKGETDIIQDVG